MAETIKHEADVFMPLPVLKKPVLVSMHYVAYLTYELLPILSYFRRRCWINKEHACIKYIFARW